MATTPGPRPWPGWSTNRVGYVFGLAGNPVLLARVAGLAEDAALGRVQGEGEKVRRFGEFRYAARSWTVERKVVARIEASAQGTDTRFIVTNLKGAPRWLYESVYCQRGQAENLIKARSPSACRSVSDMGLPSDVRVVDAVHRGLLAPGMAMVRRREWSWVRIARRRPISRLEVRPVAGGGELEDVAPRVVEIEAAAAVLEGNLADDRDAARDQVSLPGALAICSALLPQPRRSASRRSCA